MRIKSITSLLQGTAKKRAAPEQPQLGCIGMEDHMSFFRKLFGRRRRPIPQLHESATATKITREKEQENTVQKARFDSTPQPTAPYIQAKDIPDTKPEEQHSTTTISQTALEIDRLSEEYQKEVINKKRLNEIHDDPIGMRLLDIPNGLDLFAAEVNNDYSKILDILCRHSNIIQQRDSDRGKTLLHYATMLGAIKVGETLLLRGADVNSKDNDGLTPLLIACGGFRPKTIMANVLISKGADVNYQSPIIIPNSPEDGWKPLHLAARNGHTKIVELLVSHGARVNAKKADGWTPLHVAVFFGHIEVVKYLLSKGANIDATTHDGATPLMIAAEYKKNDMMKILEDWQLRTPSPAPSTGGLGSRKTLPVLVMIQSDGSPVQDDAFLEHVLNLPEVQRQVGPASQCRVRTFGSPKGYREQLDAKLGPSVPNEQRVMDTIAMLLVHAPEYKDVTNFWWCTITDTMGRKHRVTVCKP